MVGTGYHSLSRTSSKERHLVSKRLMISGLVLSCVHGFVLGEEEIILMGWRPTLLAVVSLCRHFFPHKKSKSSDIFYKEKAAISHNLYTVNSCLAIWIVVLKSG